MAEEFDRPTSNQGQKVDERPTTDSNDARNPAIFESLATGSGSAILGHTGWNHLVPHSGRQVLHKINLYSSILGFLCGQQRGQIVDGQGGEQMQGVGLADTTKQTEDSE
jgi:hypothetical protein